MDVLSQRGLVIFDYDESVRRVPTVWFPPYGSSETRRVLTSELSGITQLRVDEPDRQ